MTFLESRNPKVSWHSHTILDPKESPLLALLNSKKLHFTFFYGGSKFSSLESLHSPTGKGRIPLPCSIFNSVPETLLSEILLPQRDPLSTWTLHICVKVRRTMLYPCLAALPQASGLRMWTSLRQRLSLRKSPSLGMPVISRCFTMCKMVKYKTVLLFDRAVPIVG